MNHCLYCNAKCTVEFCSDECYQEYLHEEQEFRDSVAEDYPGESKYAGEQYNE